MSGDDRDVIAVNLRISGDRSARENDFSAPQVVYMALIVAKVELGQVPM